MYLKTLQFPNPPRIHFVADFEDLAFQAPKLTQAMIKCPGSARRRALFRPNMVYPAIFIYYISLYVMTNSFQRSKQSSSNDKFRL